jgi:hypothetical protein
LLRLSLLQLLVLLLTLPHCLLMLPLSLRQGSWHKPGSNEPLAPGQQAPRAVIPPRVADNQLLLQP